MLGSSQGNLGRLAGRPSLIRRASLRVIAPVPRIGRFSRSCTCIRTRNRTSCKSTCNLDVILVATSNVINQVISHVISVGSALVIIHWVLRLILLVIRYVTSMLSRIVILHVIPPVILVLTIAVVVLVILPAIPPVTAHVILVVIFTSNFASNFIRKCACNFRGGRLPRKSEKRRASPWRFLPATCSAEVPNTVCQTQNETTATKRPHARPELKKTCGRAP